VSYEKFVAAVRDRGERADRAAAEEVTGSVPEVLARLRSTARHEAAPTAASSTGAEP
jgi:hypothetical protein